jgi:hypothetical protein
MEGKMWEVFRKIRFFLLVLIISAGIYLVFFAEKEVRQDVLEYSLNLMGNKLLAMVPDGVGKNKLTELYEGFKQKAKQGDVAPVQIENIAASILNVSNTETSLTPQQAEGVLRSAMMAPLPRISAAPHKAHKPMGPPQRAISLESERWEALGERVKTMFEFNEHIHNAMKKHALKHREMASQIHFQVRDGLSLALDAGLRAHMNEKEFKNLAKEIKYLEREQLLEWRENLSEELEREMKEMKGELEALDESLKELKKQQNFEALEELESLKSLEHLEYIPVINADSIRKLVEKNLREADIHPPHEESNK